jgi:serpin B
MSSSTLDADTRVQYSRQSAVNFALAASKALLTKSLNLLFAPHSFYRALAVHALEVLPKFRGAFLSTLRFQGPNLSIDDFAAAVRDTASNLKPQTSFTLCDVNTVWVNSAYNIIENRFKAAQRDLGVDISTVRFPNPAIEMINQYIASATNGMILAALSSDSIDGNAAFMITNALYIHGKWVAEISATETRLDPFTRFDGSTIQTPIMQAKVTVPYAETRLAQLVFLPYADSSCEFVTILPRKASEADFLQSMLALDSSSFDSDWTANVHLRLPKFGVAGDVLSLNAVAKDLGLNELFESDEPIFPQPEGEQRVKLGEMKQRVVIIVDESARWHSNDRIKPAVCARPPDVRIDMDRPFAYLIRDRVTGTILLMGTYLESIGVEIGS